MAVYTHVPAEDIDAFLARYDAGRLVSAKGIAEGVENSNYLLETTGPDGQAGGGQRYILTLYEKRVDEADLPFFMDLLDHLGARGCRVPRFIADRDGRRLQQLAGRPACLIEFLTGISVTEPTPAQARAAGAALLAAGPRFVVIKCGAEGATLFHAGGSASIAAPPAAQFIDPTGPLPQPPVGAGEHRP